MAGSGIFSFLQSELGNAISCALREGLEILFIKHLKVFGTEHGC
jgi:hypothetical protein